MQQVTIDSLFDQETLLEGIDLLRIVTQGSEVNILNGATKTIAYFRPIIFLHTWVQEIYQNAGNLEKVLLFARENCYEVIHIQPAVAWRADKTEKNGINEIIGVKVLMVHETVLTPTLISSKIENQPSIEKTALLLANYNQISLAKYLLKAHSKEIKWPEITSLINRYFVEPYEPRFAFAKMLRKLNKFFRKSKTSQIP